MAEVAPVKDVIIPAPARSMDIWALATEPFTHMNMSSNDQASENLTPSQKTNESLPQPTTKTRTPRQNFKQLLSRNKVRFKDSTATGENGGKSSFLNNLSSSVGKSLMQPVQTAEPTLYGWKRVKHNLPKIVAYGKVTGILDPLPEAQQKRSKLAGTQQSNEKDSKPEEENQKSADQVKKEDGINIPVKDTSLIHQAIPFLPMFPALICLFLNIVAPGIGTVHVFLGTILSGFLVLCFGYPRLQVKDLQRILSCLVNVIVGLCQLGTVPILLIGWFWSIAWGAILTIHALQYREAMLQKRQAQVATVALEALTNDTLLRRREVHTLVKQERQGKRKSIAQGASKLFHIGRKVEDDAVSVAPDMGSTMSLSRAGSRLSTTDSLPPV